KDDDGNDHPGDEQQYASDKIGHVRESHAVERDHQRSENGEPVDQQAENLRGVELAAALLDEAIDARFFGQNVEIDGTQRLDRRKSQRFGDQPSDNENHDGKQHAGEEFADLHENHA